MVTLSHSGRKVHRALVEVCLLKERGYVGEAKFDASSCYLIFDHFVSCYFVIQGKTVQIVRSQARSCLHYAALAAKSLLVDSVQS